MTTEQQEEEQVINFNYFYGLHSDVTKQLTSLCDQWDEKYVRLEAERVDGDTIVTEEGMYVFNVQCIHMPSCLVHVYMHTPHIHVSIFTVVCVCA